MMTCTRRRFISIAGTASLGTAFATHSALSAQTGGQSGIVKNVESEVFIPSPGPGIAVNASSYYTTLDKPTLMSIHRHISRSDTVDIAFVRFSEDNGRTWGKTTPWATEFENPDGTGRRHPRGGYVDPMTGKYVTVWTEGVLPTDEPLEGMRQWKLHYSVSEDGGKTQTVNEQIVHEGAGYDKTHHLPGVTVGKNCVMMGDMGQRPLTRSDGVILIPVQSSPTGPDGEYYNPGAGFTYTDCMILFGRWRSDGGLSWRASERVKGSPERSTRGMIEPTIAELNDGTIIMVMRGSNDARPELPGHKWISRSSDGGRTWSEPTPWTYTEGTAFFSPSACSQLIPHSDGRLLWMGNICESNSKGNSPRYPIVLGEVDRSNGLLIRDSVSIVDDRGQDESPYLTLSNFYAREDRETHAVRLHMSRLFAQDYRKDGKPDFTADSLLYTITV